jgi:NADH dehydrogenase
MDHRTTQSAFVGFLQRRNGTSPGGADDGTKRRHRVVVVGSGFGGLYATMALRRADVDVTLIAKTTHHVFQPLLYQVATGILSVGDVAPATRDVLSRQRNARVLLGEVNNVDLAAHTVTSHVQDYSQVTPYDSLIVAAGAEQSYFGHDEFADFAPGMKNIDDALELRARIFGSFELAELEAASGKQPAGLLTFVVVGGGPTGVEMAGQVAELTRRTLRREFRMIDTATARVLLVDAADRLLPSFDASLGANAKAALEKLGVEVRLGATVVDVDHTAVVLQLADGTRQRVASATKIWAAGVQASPLAHILAAQSGATLDRAGRLAINTDLTLPGHPDVFVVGDLIGRSDLPGVAQVAIQSGKYAARQIDRRLRGRPPQAPFRYRDLGSMAIIGRFQAVAEIHGMHFTGPVGWLMWLGLHLVYLTGHRNKPSALLHWTVSFLGRGRPERTITNHQGLARAATAERDCTGHEPIETAAGRKGGVQVRAR